MKKRFLALILALAVILPFSGCSCTAKSSLSFSNAFNGGTEPTLSNFKKETVSYNVNFKSDYADEGFDYSKSRDLDKYLEYEFSDGVYTSELTFLDKNNELIKNKESDILSDESYKSGVFSIKSELKITAKYKTAEETDFTSYNDVVTQEAFFCISGKSFAPVYSHTLSVASVLTLDGTKATHEQRTLESETFYTNKKIKVSYIQGAKAGTTRESDYNVTTVVDNAQLLFALRGINGLSKESSTVTVPTVSPAFGLSSDLSVKRYKDQKETVNLTYCGEELVNESLSVTKLGFRLASSNNFGKTQMIYLQNEKTDKLPLRNLVVKYYEPLTSYGTFLSMGVLEYTLSSVNVEV